ncbi:hypothetical protein ACFWWB_18760 [Streptomyces sp. NPDC058690]|uniref:hypothetical protein n=1 Tax=Streptomyces sp. NPDC058690 TaxID=3346600 RepID=UPI00365D72D3
MTDVNRSSRPLSGCEELDVPAALLWPDVHGVWVGEDQQKLLIRLARRFGSAVS